MAEHAEYAPEIGLDDQLLACDAQTSGGLLIAVSEARAPALVARLSERNVACAAIVGRVEEGRPGFMHVVSGPP
jgi:selenide,water dikinase